MLRHTRATTVVSHPPRFTRLSDRAGPVPDALWKEAARHYDEPALAALILAIATTNVFNRLNVTTGQVARA